MKEITLRGCAWGVAPLPEDAKQLNLIHQESGEVYMIQWSPEALKELVEKLQMPNDELEALIERHRAAADLEVVKDMPRGIGNGTPE